MIGNNASLKKKMRTGKYFTNQLNIEKYLGKEVSLVIQDTGTADLQISNIIWPWLCLFATIL